MSHFGTLRPCSNIDPVTKLPVLKLECWTSRNFNAWGMRLRQMIAYAPFIWDRMCVIPTLLMHSQYSLWPSFDKTKQIWALFSLFALGAYPESETDDTACIWLEVFMQINSVILLYIDLQFAHITVQWRPIRSYYCIVTSNSPILLYSDLQFTHITVQWPPICSYYCTVTSNSLILLYCGLQFRCKKWS